MKKLRLGCVGLGRGAGLCMIAAQHPQVEVVALCDSNMPEHEKPGRIAHDLRARGAPLEKTYDRFEDLLGHDLDALLVTTPPAFHARQSIEALNRGWHVLSEIPAASDYDEARRLVQAVRASSKVYMFGENCCYWGILCSWKEMVRAGRLGKIFYAEGQYIHDLPQFVEPEKIRQQYPEGSTEHATGKTWRTDYEPIRYCTHETGPLLTILDDRIVQVAALSSESHVRPGVGKYDMQVALCRTAKGVIYKEMAGFNVVREPGFHYYCMYGSLGTVEYRNDTDKAYGFFRDIPGLERPMEMPISTRPLISLPGWAAEGHGGADGAMMIDFIDAALAGGPSPIDVYRGLDFSLPGIAAAQSAARGGEWTEVPDPRKW